MKQVNNGYYYGCPFICEFDRRPGSTERDTCVCKTMKGVLPWLDTDKKYRGWVHLTVTYRGKVIYGRR